MYIIKNTEALQVFGVEGRWTDNVMEIREYAEAEDAWRDLIDHDLLGEVMNYKVFVAGLFRAQTIRIV